jgi:FkbM family methyltransferase
MKIIVKESILQGFDSSDGMLSLPKECRRLRFDVGLSENAPQSEVWLSEYPDLYVIGFEPNPISCAKIINQSSSWPIKLSKVNKSRFLLLNIGLGPKKIDSVNFYVTKSDPGQSSFLMPKGIEVENIVKVPIQTLDEICDSILWDNIPFVEYLKTDCQGYDLEVLKGSVEVLKKRVIFCTAEPSKGQYVGESNSLIDLVNFMATLEFDYVNPKWNFFTRIKYRKIMKYLNVDDPTFINRRFYQEFMNHPFSIFQKG